MLKSEGHYALTFSFFLYVGKNRSKSLKTTKVRFQEEVLFNYVRKQLNSGKTKIVIPASLLTDVSDEVLTEVRRWCDLNDASIKIDV